MDRADPRAGQHRDRQLGHHGQVDGDAIAGLDAERLKRIREPADAFEQFGIRELQRRAVLGFPESAGLLRFFSARWRSRQL